MPDTVPVTIEVGPDAAAALAEPATRAPLERLGRRTLRPTGGVDQLFAATDALSDEARRRGLADERDGGGPAGRRRSGWWRRRSSRARR